MNNVLNEVDGAKHMTPLEMTVTICSVIVVLIVAAVCSGLNIGLLGIEQIRLETLEKCGEPSEQKAAKKVKHLMEDRHLLLCAILFFNALAMEVLPILLDELVGPSLAVIIAITGLVLFGEIIPQAVCNKYGLQIGAFVAPLLWLMIFATFAATYPLARFLDCLLGEQKVNYFQRQELTQIVLMHSNDEIEKQEKEHNPHYHEEQDQQQQDENSDSESTSHLDPEEAKQIAGAIKAAGMIISQKEVMTDISNVIMLSVDTVFDEQQIDFLYNCGHSRIPIYEGDAQNIIGVIHIKQLILYKPSLKEKLNRNTVRQSLIFLDPHTRIFDALNQFQTGKSHLAIVRDANRIYGIVTLEDLIEIILQREIFDEEDRKERELQGITSQEPSENA